MNSISGLTGTTTDYYLMECNMPVNYTAMIRKHTWWKSSSRTFVVVEIHGNFAGNKDAAFLPSTVVLLEQLTDKITPIPWNAMISMIDDGKLKQISQ